MERSHFDHKTEVTDTVMDTMGLTDAGQENNFLTHSLSYKL